MAVSVQPEISITFLDKISQIHTKGFIYGAIVM